MIVSGFPCIGKSSISNSNSNFIDLESSMFFGSDGKRPDNWVELYINIAQDLNKQGYNVFVSSHKIVRDEMIKRNIKFHSIFPSVGLKDMWRYKLESRYEKDHTEKNRRAMEYILDHYEESIEDMKNDPYPFEINYEGYRLESVVKNLGNL